MNTDDLAHIARQMVVHDKRLPAIDESIGICDRRYAALRIAEPPEMRCGRRGHPVRRDVPPDDA